MTRRTTDRHTCVRVPTRIGGYGSNYKIVSSMDAGRDFRIRGANKIGNDSEPLPMVRAVMVSEKTRFAASRRYQRHHAWDLA